VASRQAALSEGTHRHESPRQDARRPPVPAAPRSRNAVAGTACSFADVRGRSTSVARVHAGGTTAGGAAPTREAPAPPPEVRPPAPSALRRLGAFGGTPARTTARGRGTRG